jgi:ribonuclease J
MISRGFVFEQRYNYLLEDAKCLVLDELELIQPRHASRVSRIQENIRSSLRRFFRQLLDRDPMVVAIVSEV